MERFSLHDAPLLGAWGIKLPNFAVQGEKTVRITEDGYFFRVAQGIGAGAQRFGRKRGQELSFLRGSAPFM